MIDTVWIRSSFAAAVAFGGLAAAHTFVAGCGSGAQATPPPGTQAQAETAAPGDSSGKHHHHMPPPAAFDACKGKAVGDTCSVAWHSGDLEGKCETPPEGAAQTGPACRPEGGPRERHHGPPPEIVFAACDGKAAGDACTVTHERGTVQGSCMAPKRADAGAERLLCAAAHGHKHGDAGGGN